MVSPFTDDGSLFLPVTAHWGAVHLNVVDLQRSADFWRGAMALESMPSEPDGLSFGVEDRALVVLHQVSGAERVGRSSGLFHLALHVPDLAAFGAVLARLFQLGIPNSPTDHTATIATYLNDPEGNGIEITLETPERGHIGVDSNGNPFAVTRDGETRGVTEALDPNFLTDIVASGLPIPARMSAAARIGHVHLKVSDLDQSVEFYKTIGFRPLMNSRKIGMADMALNPSAPIHALAFNVWSGRGVPALPSGAPGLRSLTLELPTVEALEDLKNRLTSQFVTWQPSEHGIAIVDPSGIKSQIKLTDR